MTHGQTARIDTEAPPQEHQRRKSATAAHTVGDRRKTGVAILFLFLLPVFIGFVSG